MTLITNPIRESIQANADADMDFLKVITEPFTKLIVQVRPLLIVQVLQTLYKNIKKKELPRCI